MLNVLLVEDEFIVRKGIETILNNQCSVECRVQSAPDAIEALELARHVRPDVVITDINMPEMDGFRMIGTMVNERLCERFIVITGYERIQYTYQALHLRVLDYLVKPIDKEVLLARLAEIERSKQRTLRNAAMHLKQRMLNPSEQEQLDEDELSPLFPHRYLVFVALIRSANVGTWQGPDLVTSALSGFFPVVLPLSFGRQWAYALNFNDHISRSDVQQAVLNALRSTNSMGDFQYGVSKVLPLSPTAMPPLRLFYLEALLEAVLRMADAPEPVHHSLLSHAGEAGILVGFGFSDSIQQSGGLNRWIQRALDTPWILDAPDPYQLVDWLAVSGMSLHLLTELSGMQSVEPFLRQWRQHLSGVFDAASLASHLRVLMEQSKPYLQVDALSQTPLYPEKIHQALLYIQQHYQQDLSLNDVAEAIDLQAAYVSHLFKKTVGSSFLQVLHRTRIDAACDMLKSQRELTIEDIAKRAGYQTPTYFFRIFKTYMDMSPREYRDSSSI